MIQRLAMFLCWVFLFVACGSPSEDGVDLEDLEQPISQNYHSTRYLGTVETVGSQDTANVYHRMCAPGQLTTAQCRFVKAGSQSAAGIKAYFVKRGTGFSAGAQADIDAAIAYLLPKMNEDLDSYASETQFGPLRAELYTTTGTAQINIVPGTISGTPAQGDKDMSKYGRIAWGGLTGTLTESSAQNGSWRRGDVCTITVDYQDIVKSPKSAPESYTQLLGNRILGCLGIGAKLTSASGGVRPYTHPFFEDSRDDTVTKIEACVLNNSFPNSTPSTDMTFVLTTCP